MKKTQLFNLFFALFFSVGIFAQGGSENYILFDAACMKKYDYIRSSNYHDLPFWDFHFEVSPHQTYIFRVLKQADYEDEVGNLDKNVISCQNSRALNNEFVNAVNSIRKTAYIAMFDDKTKTYKLFQVKKIVQYTETAYALSYKDQQRSFIYPYNEINQGTNLDTSGIGRVLFEENGKFDCARQRKFRSFDKINPRLSESLFFVENIGLTKIETEQGTLELKSVNDEPIGTYVKKACVSTKVEPPIVKTPKTEPGKIESEFPDPFNKPDLSKIGTGRGVTKLANSTDLDDQGYYTVQEGDNLYNIAIKFGTKVQSIKSLNSLTSDVIDRNQKLKIPTSSEFADNNPVIRTDAATGIRTKIHIVQHGECLWDIAKRYKTTTTKLIELNKLSNEQVDIQQEIIIE